MIYFYHLFESSKSYCCTEVLKFEADMPYKRGHRTRRKTQKKGSPMGLNQSSDHSEAGHSEVNHFELGAERASPVPNRRHQKTAQGLHMTEIPDQGCFDSHQEQIDEVIQRPLQNHDRMNSGRRYCLLITVHEAIKRGCQALSKSKWNPANIADMMKDDINVTEAVILDHIATILYVRRQSAGEGLMEEEAEACIEHFSPYIKWREVVIECEFQALTLAEAHEEIWAYETQSHKSLWGREQPKITKTPPILSEKMCMGLDCSPNDFHRRMKNDRRAGYYG